MRTRGANPDLSVRDELDNSIWGKKRCWWSEEHARSQQVEIAIFVKQNPTHPWWWLGDISTREGDQRSSGVVLYP